MLTSSSSRRRHRCQLAHRGRTSSRPAGRCISGRTCCLGRVLRSCWNLLAHCCDRIPGRMGAACGELNLRPGGVTGPTLIGQQNQNGVASSRNSCHRSGSSTQCRYQHRFDTMITPAATRTDHRCAAQVRSIPAMSCRTPTASSWPSTSSPSSSQEPPPGSRAKWSAAAARRSWARAVDSNSSSPSVATAAGHGRIRSALPSTPAGPGPRRPRGHGVRRRRPRQPSG